MAAPDLLTNIYAKSTKKVLLVSTSADMLGDVKTGLWLEELAAPYNIMSEAGIDVTIASVKVCASCGGLRDTLPFHRGALPGCPPHDLCNLSR